VVSAIFQRVYRRLSAPRSNTEVTTTGSEFNGRGRTHTPRTTHTMFTLPENLTARIIRPQMAMIAAIAVMLIAFGGNTASADVNPADIEAVFGTAVEIRPPSAIVVASSSGLVTLNFDEESDLRIGSNKALVEDVAEGDRVVSTATRDSENELVAVRTLVRSANTQPITKHVVGVVSSAATDELSIQTRNGGVVNVLIPAGLDIPSIGDGITMVARLDRASGILTAVGFELTSKTVERIQDAQDSAADQVESDRLAQVAIDARSKHLSALDDAARAIKRVIESGRSEPAVVDQATAQFEEIQRRFRELQGIYANAARNRGESQPLLKISGGLVDEIGLSRFTVVPTGEQEEELFSVDFSYDPDETTVDLPRDILRKISGNAENPQLLGDVRKLIDPGSELDVKYSIDGDIRNAVSIKVKPPKLVEELEAVLEHESIRAFTGIIAVVEGNVVLEDALGVVIAVNEKQGKRVAAKLTEETEITVDGRSAVIWALSPGQHVDIQFESSAAGSISNITGTDVTLRALAIRARSSAPSGEDHLSGIVESIDLGAPSVTIRPTDGALVQLTVGDSALIVRDGKQADLEDVKIGDLVVDATRPNSESNELTSMVVVARSNVKFSGTVTGIGREPSRLQITGVNGQSLNILVSDDTWLIVDERRVKFDAVVAGMNIVNGVYTVTGRNGTFYNVATIISIETPKVGRTSGIITHVNVVEGKLTVLSGTSSKTTRVNLELPDTPLGDNLVKDGVTIRSLLEVERGDRVDIAFYVLETGVLEKLSVVSENFIQSRGTLIEVAENSRFVEVELVNGSKFELWPGKDATIHLNGRRVQSLGPVAELVESAESKGAEVSALVSEVSFIRDSIGSEQGVIISIKFQIRVGAQVPRAEIDPNTTTIETTVSGVIEAISGDRWVIDGHVFVVDDNTRFVGDTPEVGETAAAVLVSRRGGEFIARTISVSRR